MESLTIKYIKLISAILCWGGLYHVARYLVTTANVAEVAFLRYGFTSLIFAIFYFYKKKTLFVELSLGQFFWLSLIGIIGMALYNILFLTAESYISANFVAILFAFTPCVTTILGIIFLRDKVSVLVWLGLIISLIGAIFVINLDNDSCGKIFCSETFSHLGKGQIYAILSSLTMALYGILNPLANKYVKLDSLTINTYGSIIGFIALSFYWGMDSSNTIVHLFTFSLEFWLALSYVVVLGTVLSYLWFIDAILNIGVEKTVVFQNGVPFTTVLIGAILGDSVGIPVILCGGVIIIGVLLTNFAKHKN